MRHTHTHTHTHTHRGRDTGRGRIRLRKPNVGLDPRTPGSHPGPKAGAKPLSHPGIPFTNYFKAPFDTLSEVRKLNLILKKKEN